MIPARRENPHQRLHGLRLPVKRHAERMVGEQPGRLRPVAGRLGVPDGVDHLALPGEPSGGAPVQRGYFLERCRRELMKRGEEAARRAADAIQKAVQKIETSKRAATTAGTKARTEALAYIRAAQTEALSAPELGLAPEPEPAAAALAVGGRARVPNLGVVGEVLSLNGDEVELAVGGKRLRVPRAPRPRAAR